MLIGNQVINYLIGSASRIFTTLQEVPDPLILYSFVAGFALNAILALQVIWYWNAPASKQTELKKLERPITAGGASSGKSSGVAPAAGKSPSTRRRG